MEIDSKTGCEAGGITEDFHFGRKIDWFLFVCLLLNNLTETAPSTDCL